MTEPPIGTADGTLHILTAKYVGERQFMWLKGHWSTPGTGCGTRPTPMYVLGWRYVRPVEIATHPAPCGEEG